MSFVDGPKSVLLISFVYGCDVRVFVRPYLYMHTFVCVQPHVNASEYVCSFSKKKPRRRGAGGAAVDSGGLHLSSRVHKIANAHIYSMEEFKQELTKSMN